MALTTAFARNGNRKAVPQSTADGSVSYEQGFGNLYALPPEEGGLFIDRAQFNQIMYDTTSAVISNQNSINTLNSKVTANQNSINTLNSKVANIESSVSTGVVSLTGNQTIAGVKTFSSPPISATNPTANNQVANKAYVDTVGNTAVKLTGNQTIAGTKTFSAPVVVPDATANTHAVNLAQLNTKANANATVNLTGDQRIAGAKTFTSNITAPNITNLQNQMNSLVGGGKSPIILQNTGVSITAGAGGDFTKLTDALMYIKQVGSKQINSINRITLLSNFSDDIVLNAFPPCVINCNGFKLGNNLIIQRTPIIQLINLKLDGQLYAIFCGTVLVSNGTTLGGGTSGTPTFDASIVANSSNILISDNVTLNPSPNSFGIVSKGASYVLLAAPSKFTQSVGQSFVRVANGGMVSADDGVDLSSVSVTKANISANTLIYAGIIFGNVWG